MGTYAFILRKDIVNRYDMANLPHKSHFFTILLVIHPKSPTGTLRDPTLRPILNASTTRKIMSMSSLIPPTIASLVMAQFTGFLWYSKCFGAMRVKALKVSHPNFNPIPNPKVYIATGIMWLITSTMYSTIVSMTGYKSTLDLVQLSLVVGTGFSVPPYVLALCFEPTNPTVSAIEFGYVFTAILIMGLVHSFFMY